MKPQIYIIGGNGKMGKWFESFLKSKNLSVKGSSRDWNQNKKDIQNSDIVILSVPISKIKKVTSELIPLLSEKQLLVDIASVKMMPIQEMKKTKAKVLGMHPLFGPASSPKEQKIVFCKVDKNKYVDFLKKLFETAGIEVIDLTAQEHDHQLSYIQALTHALNLLYAKMFTKQNISSRLHTPTFALQKLAMDRVIHQDTHLMSGIQMNNEYFLDVLGEFIKNSKTLFDILQKKDEKMFADFFNPKQLNKLLSHVDKDKNPSSKAIKSFGILKNIKTGYLGPQGTYSHQATLTIFPKETIKKIPCKSISEIFEHIEASQIDVGIVPAENSTEGIVRGTMDHLIEYSLSVSGSFDMRIHHQLLSKSPLKNIKTIYSHPQALGQCKNWLKKNLSNINIISTESTTAVLSKLKTSEACIASFAASKIYNIPIVAKNIEDNQTNTTRFYVIAKNNMQIKGLSNQKTLLFATVYNRVGILRDILNVFADNNLNLTKLESRPSQQQLWDYHFFIEIDAPSTSKALSKALEELKPYCPAVKILGQT